MPFGKAFLIGGLISLAGSILGEILLYVKGSDPITHGWFKILIFQ
jgi:hypothetical protein